ncbi:MAG: SgcJ/EcaC family oxidoreductase [Povalibacter sp.]|jgi:uncharacterized protein (TIGR02246 family)
MRRVLRSVLLLAGLLACNAFAQTESEAEIRGIVAAQATAWNAGDCKAYARNFAPEGAFTNLFGMVMYGAAAFQARHCEILAGFYKGTRKVHTIHRIRFVTPDVAIIDIDNEIHGVKSVPAGLRTPPGGILRTQLMEVFVRKEGQWRIEAYHNVDLKVATPHASKNPEP